MPKIGALARDRLIVKGDLPQALGYRLPAEWEKHEATWLAWPHNPETWEDLKEIEAIYAEIIACLTAGEKTVILVNDEREEESARKKLSKKGVRLPQVRFLRIKTWDAWIRDYGPNFIMRENSRSSGGGRLAINRWIFNAWGSKYDEHKEDDQASRQIAGSLGLPVFEPHFVLEGGSIDGNGEGMILTTEECLLNSSRNPAFGKRQIEESLRNYLGAQNIIWLGKGIEGDDTDGHVDDIARFVNRNTVIAAVETNPADKNYEPLKENLKRLKKAEDQSDKKLNVIELPMPKPLWAGSVRLPASYANFYIANHAVLVPVFGCPSDKTVLRILEEVFPDRAVLGIRSEVLVYGFGGIHCLTHEQPAIS